MPPSFSLLTKPPNALPTLRLHPHRTPTRHLHPRLRPHRTPTRTCTRACATTGRLPCTRAGSPTQPSRDARPTASRTPPWARKPPPPPQKKPLPPKEARAERPRRAAATLHRPRAPPPAGSSAQVPCSPGAAPATAPRPRAPAVASRETYFACDPLKTDSRPHDPPQKAQRTGSLPRAGTRRLPCTRPRRLPCTSALEAYPAPALDAYPAPGARPALAQIVMPPSPAAKSEGHRAPYPAPRAGRAPNGRPRPKVSNRRSPRKARRRASSRWEI